VTVRHFLPTQAQLKNLNCNLTRLGRDNLFILISCLSNLTGKLNMNDPDTLKKLNLTWSDVWEVKILGEFSEPIRCYLYHPVGTRKTGFTQSVS